MSATPITLSDGTKCYSGPTCAWHSPTGSAKARKELRAATEALNTATSYEEVESARERLKDASRAYDASADGLRDLREELAITTDTTERQALQNRIHDAEARIVEAEQQLGAINSDSNETPPIIPPSHTYNYVPDTRTLENGTLTVVGARYVRGVYDPKVVKANIANEIKVAQETGYLPKHLKFPVSIHRYSGGYSVNVQIRGLEDKEIFDRTSDSGYTKDGTELHNRVNNIVNSYSYFRSAPYDDYPTINFGKNISFETNADRKHREDANTLATVRRVRNKLKESVIADINKGTTWKQAANRFPLTNSVNLKGGIVASRLNGTSMIVFQKGSEVVEILNLEKFDTKNQVMDALQGTDYEVIARRNKSRSVL